LNSVASSSVFGVTSSIFFSNSSLNVFASKGLSSLPASSIPSVFLSFALLSASLGAAGEAFCASVAFASAGSCAF
jgi:hypothetical protein